LKPQTFYGPALQRSKQHRCGFKGIVDDDPALVHDWLTAIAAAMLGAKPPFRVTEWLGRLVAGEYIVVMMTESRAGSNG
jgi:hypothetical protein